MNIPHVGSQLSDEAELCFCKIAKVAEKKTFRAAAAYTYVAMSRTN